MAPKSKSQKQYRLELDSAASKVAKLEKHCEKKFPANCMPLGKRLKDAEISWLSY